MKKVLSGLLGIGVLCLLFFYTPAVTHVHAAAVVQCNCLTSDMSTYTVGDSPTFTVTGATPNSSIAWTVQQDSTVISSNQSFGQQTDSTGHFVWVTNSPFAAADVGTWSLSMLAGTSTASVTFEVQAAASTTVPIVNVTVPKSFDASNFSVNSTARHYAAGQTPIFLITGAPANSPITYSYSENGAELVSGTFPTGSAAPSTSASGSFTGSLPGFITTDTASWLIGFSVGSETGVISFTTGQYPFVSSSSTLAPGSVGSAYSGSVSYGYSGTSTSVDVLLENLPTGIVPSAQHTLSGTSSTQYEVTVPVVSGAFSVGLTGTPTQGGTFPVIVVVSGSSTDPLDLEIETVAISGTSIVAPTPTVVAAPTPTSIQVPAGNSGELLQVPVSGSAVAQPYAPGTLVNSNGTIFLIIAGYQVPFLNWKSFVGLGYSTKNVINASLTGSGLTQTPGISSANVPHTWGSWVSYRGTTYYSSEQGMIPAPSAAVFTANHGETKFVLPANRYDIIAINQTPKLSPLVSNDPRVLY